MVSANQGANRHRGDSDEEPINIYRQTVEAYDQRELDEMHRQLKLLGENFLR